MVEDFDLDRSSSWLPHQGWLTPNPVHLEDGGLIWRPSDEQHSLSIKQDARRMLQSFVVLRTAEEVCAFANDFLDHPLWRIPAPPQSRGEPTMDELVDGRALISDTMTLVGRVQPVSDALVVPTLSGLLLVDQETGRILHRLNIDASGNPLAFGAQLLSPGQRLRDHSQR